MNTGTASAQDKEAALGTDQHYGNKFVKRRFFFFTNCTANNLSRKFNYYVDKY